MSQRGRPKSDEPLIGRNFNLPISLNEDLVETSRERRIAQVQIVREGLQQRLDVLNGRADAGTSFTTPIAAEIQSVIAKTLQEEREKKSEQSLPGGRHQYTFNLIEEDASEFEKLAKAFHIDDPQIFVKVLVSSALDAGPAAVRELLYGQFDADVDEYVAAKESAAKPKKVSRKVA